MKAKRFWSLALALLTALGLCIGAYGAEVDCDSIYCFTSADFSDEELRGICITNLPDPAVGTVMLGSRVLQPGDILAAAQLEKMTFLPVRSDEDQQAVVTYLPIFENKVAPATKMTISIRGKKDEAPVAEDSALETYKNLANSGKLAVSDPEGSNLTFTVIRAPKRGDVAVNPDGTFTYTPKKNKTGTDSFTYTATDAAGNVSREATVTVQVLKAASKQQYTDTMGTNYRFAAEWMKNTGLFQGETINGKQCFQPEKTVTRGEFTAMLVQSLGINTDENADFTGFSDDVPAWLKPYLAAAMRSGLTAGWPHGSTFGANQPITGEEAALMLQNALDMPLTASAEETDVPDWAAPAMSAMAQNGVALPQGTLNRGEVALALYRASLLAPNAPGMTVFARQ